MDANNANTYVDNEEIISEISNNEKKKFLLFMDTYINAGINIASNLAVLDYLTSEDEYKHDKAKKIFSWASNFMNVTIDNCWALCIIKLNCFYSNDDLSINKFLKYITGNWNKIFINNFSNVGGVLTPIITKKHEVFTAIKEAENILKVNIEIIEKIKKFRNYFFAHFADINLIKDYLEISVDDLIKILNATERIINKFEGLYNRVNTKFAALNAGDVELIIECVNEYKIPKNPFEKK